MSAKELASLLNEIHQEIQDLGEQLKKTHDHIDELQKEYQELEEKKQQKEAQYKILDLSISTMEEQLNLQAEMFSKHYAKIKDAAVDLLEEDHELLETFRKAEQECIFFDPALRADSPPSNELSESEEKAA